MGKKIYILSLTAPIGNGEVFLKNEINFWLKEKGIDVIIVPTKLSLSKKIIIPNYVDSTLSKMLHKRASEKFKHVLNPINIYKCFKIIPLKHKLNIGAFRETLDALIEQKITENWLRKLNLKEDTIFYSFWLTNSILSIANYYKESNIKVISRTHRFDLYDDTQKYNFFPFRNQLISKIDVLMPASKEAMRYLEDKYGESVNLKLKKLGVNIPATILTKKNITTYRIVSCSYISKVKRVELIAERLVEFSNKNTTLEIEWIHFGKGDLELLVLKKLKDCPTNLKFKINDFTPNNELLEYYSTNWIDAFINLSSSEGQPVSIMEVMAHGIPCIATNTGGVNELINQHTGMLLAVNHDFKEFEISLNHVLIPENFNREEISLFVKKNNSLEKQFNEIIIEINEK